MPYQIDLANKIRRVGVNVVEHDGWRTRGDSSLRPRGVVCHHTGPGTVDGLVRFCIEGRSDLPGPLAQVVLAPDGTAHIIASGVAYHAGSGGWRGLSNDPTN